MTKWQAGLLIFLIAVAVRLATLNQMGKTWDEGAYVEIGYKYTKLFLDGNFGDPFWYELSDHPPLIRYVYGFVGQTGIKATNDKSVEFFYNYFWPRIVSVILGSASAVFVVLIGYKYFSSFVGFVSGFIFALIPFFVGLSQLATLESFMMFFITGSVFFYLNYIFTLNKRDLILSGIFLGLSILTKQSSIIILPLLLVIFAMKEFKKVNRVNLVVKTTKQTFILFSISLFTIFILWPMPFFHPLEFWDVQNRMWVHAVKLPPPEVFFGRLMLVPLPYYIVLFLITTPLVLLILMFLGMMKVDKDKKIVGFIILLWFLFPFMQSFYAFKQHGVRYIIEIYAPFALLCGIGTSHISEFFKDFKFAKSFIIIFLALYLGVTLLKASPYYLDYFNEVVGGTNNVFDKRLFQLGWWGQGIGPAAFYINKIEPKKVTVAVDGAQPAGVMPSLKNIKTVYYEKGTNYDYVLVPYFNVVRLNFPENEVKEDYELVHTIKADKADLVKIYKLKNEN